MVREVIFCKALHCEVALGDILLFVFSSNMFDIGNNEKNCVSTMRHNKSILDTNSKHSNGPYIHIMNRY
jgi:hypothetical protein